MATNKKGVIKKALDKFLGPQGDRSEMKDHDKFAKINKRVAENAFDDQARKMAGSEYGRDYGDKGKGVLNGMLTKGYIGKKDVSFEEFMSEQGPAKERAVRVAKDIIRKKATTGGKNVDMPSKTMRDRIKGFKTRKDDERYVYNESDLNK